MNQSDAMTHCNAYAHEFIAKLFLQEFGSNRVSYRFNIIVKIKFLLLSPIGIFDRTSSWQSYMDVHCIRSDNLSVRAMALYFSRTEE